MIASGNASRLAMVVVAGAAILGLAACSSSSSPSPSPTSSENGFVGLRLAEAPALIMQCSFDRGIVKPPSGLPFMSAGKLAISASNESDFNSWFSANGSLTIDGKDLGMWAYWAADNDELPTAVCGKSASARTLHNEIYAHDSGRVDPWVS